jgi:hypothetical protein
VSSLALRSGFAGYNINDLTLGGVVIPHDLDGDSDFNDLTGLWVQGSVAKLSLVGNLAGDTVVAGNLPSVKLTGSIAGDVRLTGSLPKPSVTGSWAGTTAAQWIGSPKIGGTLSGTITTTGTAPTGGLSIGKLSALRIGNLTVNVPGGVSGIRAASWDDGDLHAAWVASLAVAGNCGADMTLAGAAGVTTLAKAAITGTLQDAAWDITGLVSSLTVGRWGAGSRLAASVAPGTDATYFTGDDVALAGGSVAKLSILAYDKAHGHDFGILAPLFGSIKLGAITPVLPYADGQFRVVRVV